MPLEIILSRLESKLSSGFNLHISQSCADHTGGWFSPCPPSASWSALLGLWRWRRRRQDFPARWTGMCCFPWTPADRQAEAKKPDHATIHKATKLWAKTCAKPHNRAPRRSCLAEMSKEGSIRGSRDRYQRKYCAVTTLKVLTPSYTMNLSSRVTCVIYLIECGTLLNVTKTRVWQNRQKLTS